MDDTFYEEEEARYHNYPQQPQQPAVDPDWNNGIAPPPPAPRYDYNNGSPPDQALPSTGHGWVWEGPTEQTWNADLGQWDRGVWEQRQGQGLGYTPPAAPQPSGPAPSGGGGGGSVPSLPASGINVPPASLPSNVQNVFDTQPAKTPVQSAYQTALLKYMDQSQQVPSLTDPILGPQSEVYRVQQQRNQERNRRSAVERASASGLNSSGGLDRKIEKGVQEQNFNTAQYNANLLGRELDKRRQELLSALQLASATGDNEAARALQEKLAQVSAMMQQQGLNLQGQLGGGDLALRLMQTLMGNDQFYDQLGINSAFNMENLNQRALQLGLG